MYKPSVMMQPIVRTSFRRQPVTGSLDDAFEALRLLEQTAQLAEEVAGSSKPAESWPSWFAAAPQAPAPAPADTELRVSCCSVVSAVLTGGCWQAGQLLVTHPASLHPTFSRSLVLLSEQVHNSLQTLQQLAASAKF